MIDFNKVFKKTESTTDINILIYNAIKRRQTLNFKKRSNGLIISDPFSGFIGDCEFCKHYDDISNLTTGGYCLLHHVNCGYGFTCADNTSEYKIDVGGIND